MLKVKKNSNVSKNINTQAQLCMVWFNSFSNLLQSPYLLDYH